MTNWTIEQEIKLFSLVCDYKPAGVNKNKNMAQIVLHINEEGSTFTPDQVWAKLAQHYDLLKVEAIEAEGDSDRDSAMSETDRNKRRRSGKETSRETTKDAREKVTAATPKEEKIEEPEKQDNGKLKEKREKSKENSDDALETGAYSSELSDVEGEVAELAKLEEGELLPTKKEKASGRGRRKTVKKTDESESTPRKRTRSIAKLDTAEGPQTKRRQLRASTPPTTTNKRRTRSEVQEEEPAPTPVKEEPKTRRSARQAVRRSVRNK